MQKIPLTKEQQEFATEHHSLVYKFLKANHLPQNEYYDIVIFGYLRAISRYFTESNLKQYSFSTIAWQSMHSVLSNHRRSLLRRRKMDILSLHVGLHADALPLEDTIPAQNPSMQQLEMQLLLHDLANRVSKQQMDIIRSKMFGYGLREIARDQHLSIARIKELLEEVRSVLIKLCYE